MSFENLSRETSPQVVDWMTRIRKYVKEWSDLGTKDDGLRKPLYFDPNHLIKKKFLVVPFLEYWAPYLDPIFPQKELQRHQKVYATGFEILEESFFSSATDNVSLECLMINFIRHCLVLPKDESFMVINTSLDYWLLAGPYELVMEACKGSLEEQFRELIKWAKELDDDFEPGMDFVYHIVNIYQKSNAEILRGRQK